jgi:hypothetical protein
VQLAAPPLGNVPRDLRRERLGLKLGLERMIDIGHGQDKGYDLGMAAHVVRRTRPGGDHLRMMGCNQRQMGEPIGLIEGEPGARRELGSARLVTEVVVVTEQDVTQTGGSARFPSAENSAIRVRRMSLPAPALSPSDRQADASHRCIG